MVNHISLRSKISLDEFTDILAGLHNHLGIKDRKTPPSYSIEIHKKIKNSILKIVPDGTHYMVVEKPNAINQVIKSFLFSINY